MSFGFGFGFTKITAAIRAAFSPSTLFAAGEPGGWYDPSDFSTMFQDAAGTTPVTAVEQPVGLILDKSKGLVLGPELVTNGDFSNGTTGWVAFGTLPPTISVISGELRVTVNEAAPVGAYQAITTVSGRWYSVTAHIRRGTAVDVRMRAVTSTPAGTLLAESETITSTTATSVVLTFKATSTSTAIYARINANATGQTGFFDNISVRELPGNHAYQTTTTSRPVLSARYNLLTKTEQFDDAVWATSFATVTANTVVAPDGTLTADTLVPDATSSTKDIFQTSATAATTSTAYTSSIYLKSAGLRYAFVTVNQRNSGSFVGLVGVAIDFQTGTIGSVFSSGTTLSVTSASVLSVGNGWYRLSVSGTTASSGVNQIRINAGPTNNTSGIGAITGDGTSGIYIWGASLVPANQAHLPYQRVNTATDYDSDPAKFKPYLLFDGVDDWLVTNTITPETDKAQVFAGVRKLSDAASGMLVELGPNSGTITGTCGALAPSTAGANSYRFLSGGSIPGMPAGTGIFAPAADTSVLTGIGDISGDVVALRRNGSGVETSTADQGTGNYLAYPLYIGHRAGTALPFNGHLYSLIVRFGNNLPIETIEKTEEYINTKTGAF